MKILHVGKFFWPFHGGLENYMRDLMAALGRRGITSTALVHRHDRSCRTEDQPVTLDGQEFRVVRTGRWTTILFAPISPAFPWRLHRIIRETSPDILHLHLPNPSAFWCLALPSARRIPWLVHWHADVVTESQGRIMRIAYAVYKPFEQALLKRARAIIATSAPYRDTSEALQPWLAKCHVVPLGMDADRLKPDSIARRPAEPRTSGIRVLAVGRLTYYKGFRYLVEAAAKVDNLQVDVVGEGDQSGELRALVASLDLRERVAFHGRADEAMLARLMVECDCLCLPSIERTEAFGMVLLEAMWFGKATVVSDVPGTGMGWIVDHGVTGLKVEAADAAALAGAFRQLAADRQALAEMGRNGKQKFNRMFEINHAAEGVVDTYRSLLAGRAEAEQQGFS